MRAEVSKKEGVLTVDRTIHYHMVTEVRIWYELRAVAVSP